MSTSNFWGGVRPFGIVASDCSPFDDACFTGYELSGAGECLLEDLREDLQNLTGDSLFYNFELRDGYYSGLEIIATYKNGGAFKGYCGGVCYGDSPLDLTGYDLQDCFNYDYTSDKRLKRDYGRDTMQCKTALEGIANYYNFDELVVTARFSNGETFYAYKR